MKKFAIAAAAVLAAYAAVYAADSALGGYWPVLDFEDARSVMEPDAYLWQPRFGYASGGRTTALGFLFRPLIPLDRKYVHPTRHYGTDGDLEWLTERAPLGDFHPRGREYVRLLRIYAQAMEPSLAAAKANDRALALRLRRDVESRPEFKELQKAGQLLERDTGPPH